jgi:hypothetical protein
MKRCIWCSRSEEDVSFKKRAHSIPRSLGGKFICTEVCDNCNYYFGVPHNTQPSIEIVFKELFNLSRHVLLRNTNEHKKLGRYKSEYFKINWNSNKINLKPRYKLNKYFQKKLARQLKKGVYKVFLEERARIKKDAHLPKYNFIREFARYDLGDYSLYFYYPAKNFVPFSSVDAIAPEFRFSDHHEELMNRYRMYEFFFMGHFFSIPVSKQYGLVLNSYMKYFKEANDDKMTSPSEVTQFNDVDFIFSRINK